VAKAKEAQRVAEKIITKAKRAQQGEVQQGIQARDYLFVSGLLLLSAGVVWQTWARQAERADGERRAHGVRGERAKGVRCAALLQMQKPHHYSSPLSHPPNDANGRDETYFTDLIHKDARKGICGHTKYCLLSSEPIHLFTTSSLAVSPSLPTRFLSTRC
jgi:hypothetical protein